MKSKTKSRAPLTRKEVRKATKKLIKGKHRTTDAKATTSSHAQKTEQLGPLRKILQLKTVNKIPEQATMKRAKPSSVPDPYLEAEDREIKRLEKLLGIEKESENSRAKAAKKLNTEYSLFEGIGSDFGDFLLDLDVMAEEIESGGASSKLPRKRLLVDDDSGFDRGPYSSGSGRSSTGGHLIDEDEQEASDIDIDVDDNDSDGSSGSDGEADDVASDDDIDMDPVDSNDEMEEHEEEELEEELEDDVDSSVQEESVEDDDSKLDEEQDGEEEGVDGDSSSGLTSQCVYRPVSGEDIYGRAVGAATAAAAGKYVPPARRTALANIDESSEQVHLLRRKINGLMNKLSDQSKDSVLRSLLELFRSSSVTVASTLLKESIYAACSDTTQLMSTLIPTYAAVVAALHFCCSIDIGAIVVESLTAQFTKSLRSALAPESTTTAVGITTTGAIQQQRQQADAQMLSKAPANALILLAYLYNFRALHHTLICDLMLQLADCNHDSTADILDVASNSNSVADELKIELLEQLLNHCGSSIRHDDPDNLKLVISSLTKKLNQMQSTHEQAFTQSGCSSRSSSNDINNSSNNDISGNSSSSSTSRIRFMIESLTDLKNNKMRSVQAGHFDAVKRLRKWLGSTKTTLARGAAAAGTVAAAATATAAGACLRVSLADLQNAESKGRWWRTGAFWVGSAGSEEAERRKQLLFGDSSSSNSNSRGDVVTGDISSSCARNEGNRSKNSEINNSSSSEEQQLLMKLAVKMRFTTSTQQRIFVVMMSSRDVEDAFERLSRLQLKGKEDREIARVIVSCCQTEPTYNSFYSQLAQLLCDQQRQYKITFQFCFWDAFKRMLSDTTDSNNSTGSSSSSSSSGKKVENRKAINLAKLLTDLVCSFHLPLSAIKPIDIADMTPPLIVFLSTFLLGLFNSSISEHEYQCVLDRVATTKDFAIVRDNLEFFLQRYLTKLPEGLAPDERKKMSRRRKQALKTMQEMSILDVTSAQLKQSDIDGNSNSSSGGNNKKSRSGRGGGGRNVDEDDY